MGINFSIKAQNPHYSDFWTNLSSELNLNSEDDLKPEVVIDDNIIHVVWVEYKYNETANIWYTRSLNLGETWETPIKLFELTNKINVYSQNTFSKILAVNGNTINIAFSDTEASNSYLYFIQSSDGGSSFTMPVKLDETTDYNTIGNTEICNIGNKLVIVYDKFYNSAYEINLQYSNDNGLNFTDTVIVDNIMSNSLRNLYFDGENIIVLHQFTGISYNTPKKMYVTVIKDDLSEINTFKIGREYEPNKEDTYITSQGGADYEYRSQIAKSGDTIHIVFMEYTNVSGEGIKYYVDYVRSFDNGENFEEPVRVAEGYVPTPVIIAKNNVVYIAYKDNPNLFRLICSTDGGDNFGEAQTLDNAQDLYSQVSNSFNIFFDPLDESGSSVYYVGNNHSYAKFTEYATKISEYSDFPVSLGSQSLYSKLMIDNQGGKHWLLQYKPQGETDFDLYYHNQNREPEPGEINKVFEASKLPNTSGPGIIEVPYSESLEFSDKLSLELLVKFNPEELATSNGHGPLLYKVKSNYYYGNNPSGYQIGYSINSNKQICIFSGIKTELGEFYKNTPYFIKDTLWHHIALTYDSEGEIDNFICYVDGIPKSKLTVGGQIDAGQSVIHIGLPRTYSSEYYNSFCHIDNVRMWNKALTSDEVRENILRNDFSGEENLKLFLNFDDTFKDISGNANDAIPLSDFKLVETTYEPPVADFEMYKELNAVSFINKSTNANSYIWEFGNSATSELENPIYQYSTPGEYDIYLLAKNDNSANSALQHVAIEGLDRVSPNKTGNIGQIILDIYGGTLAAENTQVILRKEGQEDIIAHHVELKNLGNLRANFYLQNEDIGKWDVVVVQNNTELALTEALNIEETKLGDNWAKIIGRGYLLENKWQSLQISYGNNSNVDSYSVPLWLCFSNEPTLDVAFLDFEIVVPEIYSENPDFDAIQNLGDYFVADSVNGKAMDARVYPILIPIIRANSTNKITLRFKAADEIKILTFIDKAWLSSEDMMNTDAKVTTLGAAECVTEVLGRGVIDITTGAVPGVGCMMEGMKMSYDTYQYAVNGKGSFWGTVKNVGMGAVNCGANLIGDLAFPVKWGLAVLNFANTMYDMKQCWEPRDEDDQKVLSYSSIDPNEIVGPNGYDNVNWIKPMEKMPYTIFFENQSSATAPAHDVFIIDTLDTNVFDFSQFSFGDFGWGDKFFQQNQENAKEFSQDIDLRPEIELIVRVAGKFDEETGAVHFEFLSLNPETMAEEEDALIGFLPPNDDNGKGEGFVEFIIGVKPNLETGREIKNKASIIFDANPAIETNEYINTIDKSIPESSVSSVELLEDESLLISWGGYDEGSGIMEYSVFMQFNDEEILPLKLKTTETSTNFKPSQNGMYKFYSLATDNTFLKESELKDFEVSYDFNGVKNYKAENNSLFVNPNPAKDFIHVKLENKEWRGVYNIEILDAQGKKFINKILTSENLSNGVNIDIRDLSKGIYIIRVYDSENYYLSKLIVN